MKNRFLLAEWNEDQREEFQKRMETGIWKELHARGLVTDQQLNRLLEEDIGPAFRSRERNGE